MDKDIKILIIGGGVSGICAATKLLEQGIKGNNILIIDKGFDPYKRDPSEVMEGFAGAGLFSDGKLTRHTAIGGQLAKYCGEDKAYQLMDESIKMITSFHPKPDEIMRSFPEDEPEFIKPYFNLRLFEHLHLGTNHLHQIGKNWFDYLESKGIQFEWECEVQDIDFIKQRVIYQHQDKKWKKYRIYNKLIYCTGKSGIGFTQYLMDKYKLKSEHKASQIGVRFESEQKYFQKLIDISYDFKLYQKQNDSVSIRTFCTNSGTAHVAIEETYNDITYNGHSLKDINHLNGKVNFGIIMEIKGIESPFEWARDKVSKLQNKHWLNKFDDKFIKTGLWYSPNYEKETSLTSEGIRIPSGGGSIDNLELFKEVLGEYANYILSFIDDMNKIFKFEDDYIIYIPEVKYVNPEVLVNHKDLSLIDYPNVYFCGDALSARGISISASQGIYSGEAISRELI